MRGVGSMRSKVLLVVLAASFAAPIAAANPVVPYCLGSADPVHGVAPSAISPQLCEQGTGRVFPEAMARPEYATAGDTGYATDFVSFPEFEAGVQYLAQKYPDLVTVHKVGESYGLPKTPGGDRDHWPIYVVEVTNKKSPVPMEDRLELLFMLSIHGNEKGGREGGMRAIEDLASGKGIAREKIQDGAGMPDRLAKPGGGDVTTYADYLDFMRVYFLFPNVDGWMHDELPYAAATPQLCGTLFCRGNGNGTDLNRQMPTIGWQLQNAGSGRIAVNEPEAKGYLTWLVTGHHWNYAIDIHGMLNHPNYVAIMMPAGSFSPQEMQRSTRLAETLKERLNKDPHFSAWTSAFGAAQQGEAPLAPAADALNGLPPCQVAGACMGHEGPTTVVGSDQFSEWSTVWDAIGYTDSGFSGDFFAQSSGLNAPGYDIEMAYNHITVDSQYEAGALFNDYHVQVVRQVVKSFMDAAALDVRVSYDTHGKRTLVLEPQYVATNLDDKDEKGNPHPTPGGWADANPGDDHWQYSATNPFHARPAKYWTDLQPFLKDGEKPGVLTMTTLDRLDAATLKNYDTLVVPGSAVNAFVHGDAKRNTVATGDLDAAKVQVVLDWVKGGGNLVLTDAALKWLDLAGVTKDAVEMTLGYAGAINLDRSHAMTKDVRGEARQTYEPVPLGFAVGINSPIWGVKADAFKAIQGDAAGTGYQNTDVSLGRAKVGAGTVQFIGALLPDPTEEYYHPYGLDDYATTYSGNQILRNVLGWSEVFAAPPVVIGGDGKIQQSANEPALPATNEAPGAAKEAARSKGVPGPETALVVGVLVVVARASRRR